MSQPKPTRPKGPSWTRRMRLWLEPGMGVKRFVFAAIAAALFGTVALVAGALWVLADARAAIALPLEAILVSDGWRRWGGWITGTGAFLGVLGSVVAIAGLNRSLLSNWMRRPSEAAVVLHRRLQLSRGPKIVAFGGGTGLSTLLRGLRTRSSNLTAVVTVADDGGSSGRLREAFGMPAPGDLSDCLAALSDDEQEVGRLMEYRFTRGDLLEGHTFGNLLITTLSEVEGDIARASRALNRLLDIAGAVWPVTSEPVALIAEKAEGVTVRGESHIATAPGRVQRLRIEPKDPPVVPEVLEAIENADLIVLGPGSLYTSVVAPLLLPDVQVALRETTTPIVFVCNIMTEAGETDTMNVEDHVTAIREHLGRSPDVVIVNDEAIDALILDSYRGEEAEVVTFDRKALKELDVEALTASMLGVGPYAQHDPERLAEVVTSLARRIRSGEGMA